MNGIGFKEWACLFLAGHHALADAWRFLGRHVGLAGADCKSSLACRRYGTWSAATIFHDCVVVVLFSARLYLIRDKPI